jgi:uncharacterized alkaline shock family protein YloU
MSYFFIKNYSKIGALGINHHVFKNLTLHLLEDNGFKVHNPNRIIRTNVPIYVDITKNQVSIRVKVDIDKKKNPKVLATLHQKIINSIYNLTEYKVKELKIKAHR